MATTPNFNIPLYTGTDTAKLSTLLNGQATALDTNLKAAIDSIPKNTLVGTDAQRLALTGTALFDGLRFRTTDTDKDWLYLNTIWVPDDSGMILLARKTGTSVSGISFDNVFSSRFRRYRVVAQLRFSNVNVNVRLRNGGVDDADSSRYGNSRIWLSGTSTVGGQYGSSSAFTLSGNTGNQIFGFMDLDGPADAATRTSGVGQFSMLDAGPGNMLTNWSGHIGVPMSHDGISLLAGTGTLSGEASIYGYVN